MKKIFSKIKFFISRRQKLIFTLAFLVILIKPVGVVINNYDYFFSRGFESQYENYKKLYYSSQFVQKKNPVIITDETFRSFAGGAFLKGLNPIVITHDHPPLGNYIIALSILLFDNPRTIMIPLLALTILGMFLVAKQANGSFLISLIPLGIFVNEPIFLNKLKYAPLIEPIQFPFILFSFYFFIKAINDRKYIGWFAITSLFIGGVISTRFFITGAIIIFCMGLFLLIDTGLNKKLFLFILTLPIALVVLIASYTKTIMDGYSVFQIFGIQKYILTYHKSKFILPFSFWDLLLFNRWHTWWGNNAIIKDPQWTLFWPFSVILTFIYGVYFLIKKLNLNKAEKFLFIWLIVYTLTLSTGYSSTNYFLAIIPFFYILTTSFLQKAIVFYFKKKTK